MISPNYLTSRTIRLLLIEDNPEDQTDLKRVFWREQMDIDLTIADTLHSAESILKLADFDIIVADYLLPDGTILTLTDLFLKKQIPFIITTGREDGETAIILMKAGAADYLIKDVTRSYLNKIPFILSNVLYTNTLKKKAEKEASMFRSLFLESADPSMILQNGIIIRINQAAITLIGIPDEDAILGKSLSEFIISVISDKYDASVSFFHLLDSVHSKGSVRMDVQMRRETSEPIYADLVCTRLLSEDDEQIHITIRDITLRVQALSNVHRYATELEDKNHELDRLAIELLSLNTNLETMVKQRSKEVFNLIDMKNDLICHIGHDLNTPLTPILGLIPILKEEITDPDLANIVLRIESNAKNLKHAISKVFELARVHAPGQGKELQWQNLMLCIKRIIRSNQKQLEKKSLTVDFSKTYGISILIDPDHLDITLENLLDNAIKFSYPSTVIKIYCSIQHTDLLIQVSDHGDGIKEKHLPHIFTEFYCGDYSRHDRNSNGLGLPIVKKVLEMYDGEIIGENRTDTKGAIFTIILKSHLFRKEW